MNNVVFTGSTLEAVRKARVRNGYTGDLGTNRSARVVYCLMARAVPVVLRGGLENVEVHHFPRADLQNTGGISASVTVIWG